MLRNILRALFVLLIVGVGFAVAGIMVATGPKAPKKPPSDQSPLVETMTVAAGQTAVRLPTQGTVQAAEKVILAPEVSGRIRWRSPDLIPGGRVPKGAPLVKLDARAYKYAVDQQRAVVERSQVELELETGRQTVAQEEWALLGKGDPATTARSDDRPQATALALRGPQMRAAKSALAAARSALASAKLNPDRTTLRAPFNAIVQTANGDVGQLVGPQTQLATLVGTDAFWVQVPVPLEWLSWLANGDGSLKATQAEILTKAGNANPHIHGSRQPAVGGC